MKTYNRLSSVNGFESLVVPVQRSRWRAAGWSVLLSSWTIIIFLMGHLSGYYYSENRIEEKTGINTQDWKAINDSYQKRLNELKEKRKNGLRK